MSDNKSVIANRTTVYPARAGGFPPASFWDAECFAYSREMQNAGSPTGICMCPAKSYSIHYPETVKN